MMPIYMSPTSMKNFHHESGRSSTLTNHLRYELVKLNHYFSREVLMRSLMLKIFNSSEVGFDEVYLFGMTLIEAGYEV